MAQTVLVADSDRTTLELVTAVLTRDGFEVVATPDGGDALARFFETSPFLVICAESLSGVSGSELCRQIKAQSASTWVVLLHGQAGGIDGLGLAGEIGCDAVLPVPFKYGELKKLLVEWQAVSDEHAAAEDHSAFAVPTPEHFKLEMPPPVALPADLAPSEVTSPAASPAPSPPVAAAGIPPLPVPIPLPVGGSVQPEDEIPEMDLTEISMPEVELQDVIEEEIPPAPGPAPAPSAVPALDIPMDGSLSLVPFPRLVYKLYLSTFSGIVHLASTAANRAVYFWGGIPVRVDSNQLSESLGRMLLEHGRITIDQYQESMRLMKEKRRRHGESLVEIGAISQADLLDALREQTEVKVANTFAWREAAYRIEVRTDFARDSVLSEVHPLRVIWRGVHEHYELDALLEYFLPLQNRYVVGTDLFPVYYDTLGSHLRDLDLPAQLSGAKTVDQVLQSDPRTLAIAQALYVLLVTDMVRAAESPGAPVQTPAATAGSGVGVPADAETVARLAEEIAAEYLRVKESDYFDALRVDTSSSPEDVDAAYTNIVSALRLDTMPAGMPDDVLRRAREIKDILARARAVVRDPTTRDNYLREQQLSFARGLPGAAPVEEDDIPVPQQPQSLELAAPVGDVFGAQSAAADGQSLMRQGRYKDAAEKFRAAIAAASGEPSYRVALGQALWKAGGETEAARAQAVTCLQQALQLDPAHIEANLEMAHLLVETGKRDRAYAYLQRVLQKQPSHPIARRLLASLG